MDRLTRKNPNTNTYRVWINKDNSLRIEGQGGQAFVFGDIVDRLGAYEDIGSVEDIKKKIK